MYCVRARARAIVLYDGTAPNRCRTESLLQVKRLAKKKKATTERLSSELRAFGFGAEHVQVVHAAIMWAKQQQQEPVAR